MASDDAEFLMRRIAEERRRAEEARDPAAYRSHADLAQQYERRLAALRRGDPAAPAGSRTRWVRD